MASNGHTFLPSLPILEAVSTLLIVAYDVLVQFFNILSGFFNQIYGWEGTRKAMAAATHRFGLSSHRWKRPSTLPTMVYGILVESLMEILVALNIECGSRKESKQTW